MGLQDQIVTSFAQNWPVIIGIAVIGWWAFPILFKLTLQNGGGKEMRKIIDAANAEQSKRNAEVVADAIERHEEKEKAELRAALAEHRILMEHWLREERFPVNPSEE